MHCLVLLIILYFSSRISCKEIIEYDFKNNTNICECARVSILKQEDNLALLIVLSIFLLTIYTIIIVLLTYALKSLRKNIVSSRDLKTQKKGEGTEV
jgi:hypothetical protein